MGFNATANKDKGSSDLQPVPVGLYGVEIEEATLKLSKSSSKEMVEVIYNILEGPEGAQKHDAFRNRKIYDYFPSEVDFRVGDFFKLGRLCGLTEQELSNVTESVVSKMRGRSLKIRVTQEARKDKPGEMSNRASGGQYFPYSPGAQAPTDLPAQPAMPPAGGQGTLPFNTVK